MYCEKFVRSVACSVLFAAMMLAAAGCVGTNDEEQAEKTATQFANYFFNYELKEAAALTTDDSRRWISFVASNIDEATVDLIRNKQEDATVSIDDITINTQTIATAKITVRNFVWNNGMEGCPIVEEKACFTLHLRKDNGKWLIRMDSLPQSGMQGRD